MLLAQGSPHAQAPPVALPSRMVDEDDMDMVQFHSSPTRASCSRTPQGMIHVGAPSPLHNQGNSILFTSAHQDVPLQQGNTLCDMLALAGLDLGMILAQQHHSSPVDGVHLVRLLLCLADSCSQSTITAQQCWVTCEANAREAV